MDPLLETFLSLSRGVCGFLNEKAHSEFKLVQSFHTPGWNLDCLVSHHGWSGTAPERGKRNELNQ